MTPSRFTVDPHILDNVDLSKVEALRHWQHQVSVLFEQIQSGVLQLPPTPSTAVYLDGTGNWSVPPTGTGGGGDMFKATYDTNANGVCDTCDSLAWSKLTGVPASFTPTTHAPTHLDNGTDPIPVATTSRTGSLRILNNNSVQYLDGTGNWSTPAVAAPPSSLTDLGSPAGNSTVNTGSAFLIAVNLKWTTAANWTLTLQNVVLGAVLHLRFLNNSGATRTFTISATNPSAAAYTIATYVPGSGALTGVLSIANGSAINVEGVAYTVGGNPTIELFGFGSTG